MEDSENRTETAADDATERGRISHIAVTLTIPVGIPRPENGRIGFYGRIRHRLRRIRLIQGRIGGGLGRIRRQGDGNAFVMGLHEFVPVGRRPAGGRDWRRFERFAQMRQDLPDRRRHTLGVPAGRGIVLLPAVADRQRRHGADPESAGPSVR
jgi:hypothetical protein